MVDAKVWGRILVSGEQLTDSLDWRKVYVIQNSGT